MKVLETLRGDKDTMTGFKALHGAIYKSHRRVNRPYVVLYSKLSFLDWRLTCFKRPVEIRWFYVRGLEMIDYANVKRSAAFAYK